MIPIEKPGSPEEMLEHFGVKGMRWGVHKQVTGSSAFKNWSKVSQKNVDAHNARRSARTAKRKAQGKSPSAPITERSVAKTKSVGKTVGRGAKRTGKGLGAAIDNTVFELSRNTDAVHNHIVGSASERLVKSLPSIKARHGEYGKLRNRAKKPFSKEARAYRADVKKSYLKHLETSANELTNVRGTRQYTLSEYGKPNTSQYYWRVQTKSIKHADLPSSMVRPIFDSEGWIVDIEAVGDDEQVMAQGIELVNDILSHSGTEQII